jgi:hypothetical protein
VKKAPGVVKRRHKSSENSRGCQDTLFQKLDFDESLKKFFADSCRKLWLEKSLRQS